MATHSALGAAYEYALKVRSFSNQVQDAPIQFISKIRSAVLGDQLAAMMDELIKHPEQLYFFLRNVREVVVIKNGKSHSVQTAPFVDSLSVFINGETKQFLRNIKKGIPIPQAIRDEL